MTAPPATRIAPGTYQVEHQGRRHIVYVAGLLDDVWAFTDGRVYRTDASEKSPAKDGPAKAGHTRSEASLAAPMPATVLQVLTRPGASVK